MTQATQTESERSKGVNGAFWKAVYGTITAFVVGTQAYLGQKVISHESELAERRTESRNHADRINELELHGSKALDGYQSRTDTVIKGIQEDVKEIRSWVIPLQSLPTKLDNLIEGQKRLEATIQKHMDEKPK